MQTAWPIMWFFINIIERLESSPRSFSAYRVGQDPSHSKSSRLVTCWHNLRVLPNSFGVYSSIDSSKTAAKGHFTHETESPWPLHFDHSHWWKRQSEPKFASHCAWGTNGVRECKMDVSLHGFLHGIEWIMFHGHLDDFQKPPLGGRPNPKTGDPSTPNAHNRGFSLFYHGWGPTWMEIHWNSIWLRVRSHMTSHDTCRSVTTLHDVGGVLGRPLDTFFWYVFLEIGQIITILNSFWVLGGLVCILGATPNHLPLKLSFDRWPITISNQIRPTHLTLSRLQWWMHSCYCNILGGTNYLVGVA